MTICHSMCYNEHIIRNGEGLSMLPEAFLQRTQMQLGEEYEDFLKALERPRAVALRYNSPERGKPRNALYRSSSALGACGILL